MSLSNKLKDLLLSALGSPEVRDELVDNLESDSNSIQPDGSTPFASNQSMGGHKLTDLADPTDNQDAATKAYVLAHTSTGTVWGAITGTLSNQTDLQSALNGKQASGSYATGTGTANGTNTGDVTLNSVGSSPSANGASLSGQSLTLQPADGTHPGLITSGSQTIGGAKTFSNTISASNLSGTNTGDQTITLTGAVTGSGTGSFAVSIPNNSITNAEMVNMANNTMKANNSGISAAPSDVSFVSTATASSGMQRDINVNTQINNIVQNFATTVTNGTTTTLNIASAPIQEFTGTSGHNIKLPNATTLVNGWQFTIINKSNISGGVTLLDNGSNTLAMLGVATAVITLASNGTANGVWDINYSGAPGSNNQLLYNSNGVIAATSNGSGSIIFAGGGGISVGTSNTVNGVRSSAFGQSNISSATNSFAVGQSTASGVNSVALSTSVASGVSATSVNSGTASGSISLAAGSATAQGQYQTAIGRFNVLQGNDPIVSGDEAFIIGNGTGTGARHNAYSVTNDGIMKIYGTTSGSVGQKVSASTSTYTVSWPSTISASNGLALTSDTSGNLSWTSVPTGTGSANGTNTGDITLTTVGSSPNNNAASLSGQVLRLQPFDSTHPGVVPASGGGTTNFLRADGTFSAPPGGSSVTTGSQVINNGDTINSDKDIYFISSTQTDPGVVDAATVTAIAASSIPQNSFWQIESADFGSNVGFGFYVWYNKDGGGTDPNPGQLDGAYPTIGSATGIQVAILSSDNPGQVATKTFNILNNIIYSSFFSVSGLADATFTITAALAGGFFNEDSFGAPTGFTIVDPGSGVTPTYASVTTSSTTAIQAGTIVGQQLKLINQSANNYSAPVQQSGGFGQITIKGFTITTSFGQSSVDKILKPFNTLTLTWTGRAWTLDSDNLS